MLWTIVTLLAAQPEPVTVAAFSLKGVGIDEKKLAFYSDYLAQVLAKDPTFRVTSEAQVATLVGLERQRQLLGCVESSCGAELAGALGVEAVLSGSIARLESGIALSLRLTEARAGRQIAGFTEEVPGEKELLAAISRAANALAADARKAFGREAPAAALTEPRVSTSLRSRAWIPAAGGAALLVAGAVCYGLAKDTEGRLRSGDASIPDTGAAQVAAAGKLQQSLAFVLGGVGVGALLTAGGFAIFGGEPATEVSFLVVPGGGAVAVHGHFP